MENTNYKIPTPEELKKLREPKYIVDIKQIQDKDILRIKAFASEIMTKHESKLDNRWKIREIVTSGEIEPENIDVRAIYPFKDLNWIIYRRPNNKAGQFEWGFVLMSGKYMLSISRYWTI